MNKVNPMAALLIAVGILVILGCIYMVRNKQDSQEVKETSKRGEERGRMMMGGSEQAKQMMQDRMKTGGTPP